MKEHREIIERLFGNDEYARSLGIVLDELTDTKIRMHMRLDASMLNFFGMPHGAAIYSLADAAFSVLGNNSNNVSVAENISMNKRTGSYIFAVYTEKGGDRTRVATMKSVSFRTGRPIDPDVEQ